jgi:hypothetical protein
LINTDEQALTPARKRSLHDGTQNRLVAVTVLSVHKHIRSIFAKLDLAPTDRADRRVTAVLRYLENTQRRG